MLQLMGAHILKPHLAECAILKCIFVLCWFAGVVSLVMEKMIDITAAVNT